MRRLGSSSSSSSSASEEKRITATTRQLESMIRLSEAHARMRFSSEVEEGDVVEAVRLMKEAIKTSAMDPRTGKIDMALLTTTGVTEGMKKMREDMRRALMVMLDGGDGGAGDGDGEQGSDVGRRARSGRGVRWNEVVQAFEARSSGRVDWNEFGEVVRALEVEGVVKVVGGYGERGVLRRMVE